VVELILKNGLRGGRPQIARKQRRKAARKKSQLARRIQKLDLEQQSVGEEN
jgi:hypothetical protein